MLPVFVFFTLEADRAGETVIAGGLYAAERINPGIIDLDLGRAFYDIAPAQGKVHVVAGTYAEPGPCGDCLFKKPSFKSGMRLYVIQAADVVGKIGCYDNIVYDRQLGDLITYAGPDIHRRRVCDTVREREIGGKHVLDNGSKRKRVR